MVVDVVGAGVEYMEEVVVVVGGGVNAGGLKVVVVVIGNWVHEAALAGPDSLP